MADRLSIRSGGGNQPLMQGTGHPVAEPATVGDPAQCARSRIRGERRDGETARLRDLSADLRDAAATRRDRAAESEEASLLTGDDGLDATILALVSACAVSRAEAAADRASAASDRHLAAQDRASALEDSGQAQIELAEAHLDGLTGAQRRELGRTTLQHEIERSRRSGQPFALAFVDVDGLKELNDREGHAAGDALLRTVVVALRSQMRSYDPIVRVGGDEFLCGFTNTDLDTTRRRVDQIRAAIAPGPRAASISVGIAVLGERDTLEMLIARADADMYACKELRRTGATSVVGRSPTLR